MKWMNGLCGLVLAATLACSGSSDRSAGGGDGASDGTSDGQDSSNGATDGTADSDGSDGTDGTTDGTAGVCTPGAARCEEQVSFTCNSEGSAEESWDCSKDEFVCVDGSCVSEPVDCVNIRPLDIRTNQPTTSSVAVVFAVDSCDGKPVIGLNAAQLEVREDGETVSATESSVTILQRQAEVFVSLVLDNSPSVKAAGALDSAVDAAKAYASAILEDSEGRVRVSVSFFSKALVERLAPSTDVDAVLEALEELRTDTTGFNTTNLYGAVVDVLASSRSRQEARRQQVNGGVTTLGQVVLFTDGDDQAGVKTLSEATVAVAGSPDDVIMLALGGEVEPAVIEQLGRNGSYIVSSVPELSGAFTEAAKRTRDLQKRIYVLGYCSPKLAKEHELSLSVVGASGVSPGVTFDASSFDAGNCSSVTFEAACEDRGCGGLLCGECGEGSCGGDQCNCPANRAGLHCEACSERFDGPTCDECLAKFAGPNCDECADPTFTGVGCNMCSNPKYAAPGCTTCAAPWSGPSCGQCSCPEGQFCEAGGCSTEPPGFSLIASAGKSFMMGSPLGELGRGSDEVQHEVTFTYSFFMEVTEVTQEEWAELMGNNPSYLDGCTTCPVETVSYWDALGYANSRSESEGLEPCYDLSACTGTAGTGSFWCSGEVGWPSGLTCEGYRLPTEAEWEYAARGGTTGATYAGELTAIECDDQTLPAIAWFCGNGNQQVHPVGELAANDFGLYDMLGNVWEWTWDAYTDYAPEDATDPVVDGWSGDRVLRGGNCESDALRARAATRADTDPSHSNNRLGFRLSRSVP